MFGLSLEECFAWANTGIVWGLIVVAIAGGVVAASTVLAFRWQGEIDKQRVSAFEAYRVSAATEIARANESAALANAKAQQATLELAKLNAPRSLGSDQISAIKAIGSHEFDVAVVPQDPEALAYAQEIEKTLVAAGWTQIDWNTGEPSPDPARGQFALEGVRIDVHAANVVQLFPVANALASAIDPSGLDAISWPGTESHSPNTGAIHVNVGRKILK